MKTQAQLIDELKQTEIFTQAGLYEQASPNIRRIFDSASVEGRKATLDIKGGITVSGNGIVSCYDHNGSLVCKGGRGINVF